MTTGMYPRSAPWRTVGSMPISMAMPTMAKAVIPQSRSAMSNGVPSNADMVILSKIASLGSGFISGTNWNAGASQLVPEMNPLPSEAIFDKITMSAFEGTPLDIALRDCGITAFAIVGIAMEIGIEPTVRHGADLGYIPVVIKDACGFGHRDAAQRSIASLEYAGDALVTNM